ncbi:MAG TPA: hypothetical protein VMC85_25455 [Desulfomonilaceae bacterium]|nr:hypothetical protein [Desulfomonilaceae bacterium]
MIYAVVFLKLACLPDYVSLVKLGNSGDNILISARSDNSRRSSHALKAAFATVVCHELGMVFPEFPISDADLVREIDRLTFDHGKTEIWK